MDSGATTGSGTDSGHAPERAVEPSFERATRLPTGTVTLLFTDIEGSTRLWEEHPEAMTLSLVRHDLLLRSAIERFAGYVFKTVGDAFCAAFSRADDAVTAAVAAQQDLKGEDWPAEIVVRVRMALHTGRCEERADDYFGPTVNRVARLAATAHGGQIVVSESTADQLDDAVPAGVTLVDLGEHRLKDLGRPLHAFQVVAVGIDRDFPPLRSLDNPLLRHNLPGRLSSFVGREDDVVRLCGVLRQHRLVTLFGAGGAGKTRLSLQVAAEFLGEKGDGVWFVDLATVSAGASVAQAVAAVLQVTDVPGQPLTDTLLDVMRTQSTLLVLDNCEHVVDSCAHLVDAMLSACPKVSVLATSREPLGITGEVVDRIPSLSLPPADARTAKEAGSFEAVRLFCERAAAIEPSFTLDDTDVGAVVSICRRLDGMPLAIELAVARLSSLSVTEIDGRLHRRFRLLTGGSRVLLRRQQTLETAIDWSHDLLNEAERAVLRRVSTFLGGFDLLAAEAVAADDVSIDADEVLDILDSLVNKSLVLADRGGASVRFSLLETIREYGKERLADAGDGDSVATKGRHARYYLSVVEQAAKHSNTESQQEWLARLDLEHDNIRTALLEFTARGQPGPALRMGSGAASYWKVRGHYREGIELLTKALENRAAPDELRAAALLAKGTLLSSIGDLALAQESLAECAAATGDNADPAFISKLEYEEAYICFKFGRHEEASARADQAVTSAKLSGNPSLIALALSRRASLTTEPSSDARSELVEAMKYFNQAGDEMQAIQCLHDLGLLELETGDPAAARVHFEEALRATERLGDFDSLPYLAVNSGWADLLLGDIDAARHAATRALTLCRRRGDRDLLPYAVLVVALCASRSGDWEAAAQLHGAADLLLGIVDQPFEPFEADLRQKDQTELVEALGRPAFDRAYDAGGAGAVDNVLERALRLCTVESHVTERSR